MCGTVRPLVCSTRPTSPRWGAAIEPGSVAAILIYEILWEIALADTLAQHGARLISDGRIDPEAAVAALDLTESH